jgi:hypothetical protein
MSIPELNARCNQNPKNELFNDNAISSNAGIRFFQMYLKYRMYFKQTCDLEQRLLIGISFAYYRVLDEHTLAIILLEKHCYVEPLKISC